METLKTTWKLAEFLPNFPNTETVLLKSELFNMWEVYSIAIIFPDLL